MMKRLKYAMIAIVLAAGMFSFIFVVGRLRSYAAEKQDAAFRSLCRHNLRAIGIAMHNYHDHYGAFPPASIVDADGHPIHSWRVLILPYTNWAHLYDDYRFDEPWNSMHNSRLADQIPGMYRCPRFVLYGENDEQFLTNYVAITATDGLFSGSDPVSVSEMTDEFEETILVIETSQHAVHWMQPVDIKEADALSEIRNTQNRVRANHHNCVNCLFCDGDARPIPHDVDASKFHGLITRDGHEVINGF